MTIRKPNHDGYQAHGMPYPSLPSSPIQQISQRNGNLIYHEESVSVPQQGEGKVQGSTSKGDEGNKEYKSESSPSLSFRDRAFTKDSGVATNNVPAAVPVQPIDMTPRSSFDSHRSQKSSSPGPVFDDAQEDRHHRSKIASNNPFLKHLDSSTSVPMRSIGEESSATIWWVISAHSLLLLDPYYITKSAGRSRCTQDHPQLNIYLPGKERANFEV